MTRRIAGIGALLVFAVAVMAGLEADNTFSTTISRALVAMGVTLVVGLIVGAMAQAMFDENRKIPKEKREISHAKAVKDR